MIAKIYYNGVNPFSGICPTPYIGRTADMIRYGDRWGMSDTFKLRGVISGQCSPHDGNLNGGHTFAHDVDASDIIATYSEESSFEYLLQKQQQLIAAFSEDYKHIQIIEGDSVLSDTGTVAIGQGDAVFAAFYAKITDISFDQSNYAYGLPFTVTLQTYPQNYFSGQFGILDPKDETRYVQNDNATVGITRTISARGFVIDDFTSNALINAQAWVSQQRAEFSAPMPNFISGVVPSGMCLVDTVERVNRLSATYEVTDTFIYDTLFHAGAIMRYTLEYSKDVQDGKATIEIKGDVTACKNGTIADARTRLNALNVFSECANYLLRVENRSDLNPTPITKGFTEDPQRNKISFQYVFNDDLSPPVTFDYTVNFEYDWENDLISADINGQIKSNLPAYQRFNAMVAFANQLNLYSILLPWYNDFASSIGISYPLNSLSRSYTRTENKYDMSLSLTARFDNSPIPPIGLKTWDYSIEISPPLEQFSDIPCLDGEGSYTTFDLGFKTRKTVSIQSNAIGADNNSPDGVASIVKTQILAIQNQFVTANRPKLESQAITYSNGAFGLIASAQAAYSCDDVAFSLP